MTIVLEKLHILIPKSEHLTLGWLCGRNENHVVLSQVEALHKGYKR